MTIAVVQHASGTATFTSGTTGTLTVTLGSPTGSGNCLVACISSGSGPGNPSVSGVTLGGGAGNWAAAVTGPAATGQNIAAIWADPAAASGQTSVAITAAFGGTASGTSTVAVLADVYEVSGLASSAVTDKTVSAKGSSSSWSSGTTATTSQAAEIWFGVTCTESLSAPTLTGPSSPWANEAELSASYDSGLTVTAAQVSGYQVTAVTGQATYNGTAGASVNYSAAAATFLGAPPQPAPLVRAFQPARARITPAFRRGRAYFTPAPRFSGKLNLATARVTVTANPVTIQPVALTAAAVTVTAHPVTVVTGPVLTTAQVTVQAGAVSPLVLNQAALVQQVTGSDTSGYGLGTTPITTSDGNALVAWIAWDTINTSISLTIPPDPAPKCPAVNVTDSAGNLWQQCGMSVSNGYSSRAAIWACVNAEPVTWVSVALTGYASSCAWTIAELAAVPQALAVDFSVNDTTAPLITDTISVEGTATGTDIVLGLLAVPVTETLDPAITAGPAGLTALESVSAGAAGGSGIALYPYWAPAAEAGTVTASWTLDQSDVLTAVLTGIAATGSPPVQENENFPLLVIEAAFGAQPGDQTKSVDYLVDNESVSWTDISARVLGTAVSERIGASRGRQYELTQEEAGEVSIWLTNQDGAFTPSNAASPYYSNAINANMSFQSGVSPWAPSGNASLAQSDAYSYASAPGAQAAYSLQVTPDGATAEPGATSQAADITVAAGRIASQVAASQTFTTSGEFTAPAGITSVGIECWGGGGGGGGSDTAAGSAGGGGGGGEYARDVAGVTPGDSYSYTVGAAGTAGPGSGSQQVVQSFTGSTVWTCPAGVTAVKAECWGGGGNGGGTNGQSGGGGGGGAEYAAEPALSVTPGHTYTVSVGGATQATAFAGDAVTVTAHGGHSGSGVIAGAGGSGSTNSTHSSGGAGGAGSFQQNGGTGSGSASGSAGSGGSQSYSFTPDTGVTTVAVAVGGGGGGGQGGGAFSEGFGGNGGGGGGYASGTLKVTAGKAYTWYYGNGGTSGQSGGPGYGPGGDSYATGDAGTSVYAYGGGPGNGVKATGGAGGGASSSGGSATAGSAGGGGSGRATTAQGGAGGGGGGGGANGAGQDSVGQAGGSGGGNGGAGGSGSSSSGSGNDTFGVDGGNGTSTGGGGGGGGGANTATSGASGGWGGAGFLSYSWSNISYVPYGGGGGGSAAPSGAGNTGSAATSSGPGLGASPLPSGGTGGNGGEPGIPAQAGGIPGAGGGGGTGTTGASGAGGQVRLTYTSITSVGNGGAGQATSFTGDSLTVTAHGGAGGLDGTTGGKGAGGAGGTGSANAFAAAGGSGAPGTGSGYGGGGGGSGGTSSAGQPGSGTSGGSAVAGGGAGGAGSQVTSASQQASTPAGIGGAGGGGCEASGYTAGAAGAPGAVRITFTPSGSLSASAWFYAPAGWASGAQVAINWHGITGNLLATSTGTAVPLPAATWTQAVLLNASAPPGAASASVTVQLAGTPSAAPYYVAEAALVFGTSAVQTGLIRIMTPIRISAWWNGRQHAVWYGYAERWPQDWPDLPQWGWSQMTATDAVAVASGNAMPSAMQGAILADNPYVYLPATEQYTTAEQGPTTTYDLVDANGLIAIDYATGNQATGTYADGTLGQVAAGLALNLLGDQNTGMGTSSYQAQDSGDRGPSLFYTDPALPVNATGSGFTAEMWFAYAGSAQTCTIMTMYGPPSTFAGRGGYANGAMCSAYIAGAAATATVIGPGGNSLTFPCAPDGNPQHFVITSSVSDGLSAVYLNGVSQGNITLAPASQVTNVTMGPGRYSYDCQSAYSYESFNFAAGHLAVYDYQLTPDRILAHYEIGANGAAGVTGAQRFAQILTWGQVGLKRGAYWWQSATGNAEVTKIGPAYDLNGSSAADGINQVSQEEGGRSFAQANGSYVYLERWAGYNLTSSAAFGDNASAANTNMNPYPSFAGGLGPWSAINGTLAVVDSPVYTGAFSGALTPSGSPFTVAAIDSAMITVEAGQSYLMSAWVQVVTGSTNTQAGFDWFDSAGNNISTSVTTFNTPPEAWVLLSATQTAPAGAVYAAIRVGLAGSPAPQSVLYLSYAAMYPASAEVPFEKSTGWDFDNTYTYSEVQATQQYGPNQLIIADVRNLASEQEFFRRSALQYTVQVVSPYDVNDITTWSLARFAQPILHNKQLVIEAANNPQAAFPVVLSIDIGDVVTVTRRPVGGAAISETGIVERVKHSIGPGKWTTTYQLSPYSVESQVLTVDGTGDYGVAADNSLGW